MSETTAAPAPHRVSVLELFFDLVFVFAITQVTSLLASDLTLAGLGRGLLILALLWWSWVAYAWLTNSIAEQGTTMRLTIFVAMISMLIASLAVPGALGDDALLFMGAYGIVRMLHVVLYSLVARGSPQFLRGVLRLAAPLMIAVGLLIAGAFLDGKPRWILWGIALVLDYSGPLIAGTKGWAVDVGHFVERHGAIVIIALGEAIVSIGVGATGVELDRLTVGSAILGGAISCLLWWTYFDSLAEKVEHALAHTAADKQVAAVRDGYTYFHLPIVAGVVLLALGIKKSLAHSEHHLELVPAIGLLGGLGLFLLGEAIFQRRVVGTIPWPRVLLGLAAFAAIPTIGTHVDAFELLAIMAAALLALVIAERALGARST